MALELFDVLNREYLGRTAEVKFGPQEYVIGKLSVAPLLYKGGYKDVLVPAVFYSPSGRPDIQIRAFTHGGTAVLSPRQDNPQIPPSSDVVREFINERMKYERLRGGISPLPGHDAIPKTNVGKEYIEQQAIAFEETPQDIIEVLGQLFQSTHLDKLLEPVLIHYKKLFINYIALATIAPSLEVVDRFHTTAIDSDQEHVMFPSHQDLSVHLNNILIDISRGPKSFVAYLTDISRAELGDPIKKSHIRTLADTLTPQAKADNKRLARRFKINLRDAHIPLAGLPQEEAWGTVAISTLVNNAYEQLKTMLSIELPGISELDIDELISRNFLRLMVGQRINDGMMQAGYQPLPGEAIQAIIETYRRDFLPFAPTQGMPIVRPLE